jgi:hypothetical protein
MRLLQRTSSLSEVAQVQLHVVNWELGVAQWTQGVLILSKQAILPVARLAQWE